MNKSKNLNKQGTSERLIITSNPHNDLGSLLSYVDNTSCRMLTDKPCNDFGGLLSYVDSPSCRMLIDKPYNDSGGLLFYVDNTSCIMVTNKLYNDSSGLLSYVEDDSCGMLSFQVTLTKIQGDYCLMWTVSQLVALSKNLKEHSQTRFIAQHSNQYISLHQLCPYKTPTPYICLNHPSTILP